MLHIYLIKAPSHTSVSQLKEEKWAMDGFVSIFLLQKIESKFFILNHTRTKNTEICQIQSY